MLLVNFGWALGATAGLVLFSVMALSLWDAVRRPKATHDFVHHGYQGRLTNVLLGLFQAGDSSPCRGFVTEEMGDRTEDGRPRERIHLRSRSAA